MIIPRSRSEEPIRECLEAIAGGTTKDFEAIVVDSSSHGGGASGDAAERGNGAARILRSDRPLAPQEARNRGAAVARGEAIVFTDADCIPRPDWLERLLEGHAQGSALVGGSIDPDGGRLVERGADICKFAPWLEGLPPGERRTLPTANMSVTREAWERIGPFTLLAFSGDTDFCLRAVAAGIAPRFVPAAIVRHDDAVSFSRFIRERRERGGAYAGLRVEAEGWSRARALAYVLAAPLIAAKLATRGIATAIRSGRTATAAVTAPITALGFAAWTLGEAGQYLRWALGGSKS